MQEILIKNYKKKNPNFFTIPNSNLAFEIVKIKTSKTEMTLQCLFRFFCIIKFWNLEF